MMTTIRHEVRRNPHIPKRHQKKRNASETPKRRSKIDQDGGRLLNGQITWQLRKTATRNSHNKQARAHTTSIFRLQRPNFPKTRHKRPTRRREEHPRHRNRNGDRKPTRIGDCSLAWAECAMIAKHEQKHVAAATDRRVGTLDKHLPSPTTKFPQNAPPARRQKKKRAPETHKRRSKIDQDRGLFVGMGWVRGDCENRTETRSSRNRQARGNTR